MTNAVQTQIQIEGRRGKLNCLLFEPENPADDCSSSEENFRGSALFLPGMPLYMIGGSRDHYAPPSLNCRPLIDAVHAAGGGRILYREFPAGHYGDESRNGISRSILEFFTQNK